jgi:hypothetical protein
MFTQAGAKAALSICTECLKGATACVIAIDVLHKVTHGGPADVGPIRSYALNKQFPNDRTKI